jgi:hypothetical protein
VRELKAKGATLKATEQPIDTSSERPSFTCESPRSAPKSQTKSMERVLRRFRNVAEYLGDEGVKFRARCGMRPFAADLQADWSVFLAKHQSLTEADIGAELEAVHNVALSRLHPSRK